MVHSQTCDEKERLKVRLQFWSSAASSILLVTDVFLSRPLLFSCFKTVPAGTTNGLELNGESIEQFRGCTAATEARTPKCFSEAR